MELFYGYSDIVTAALTICVIILMIITLTQRSRIRKLDYRISRLSAGSDGESLEDLLIKILDNYDGINRQLNQNTDEIRNINRHLHIVIQKIGIVKYDAFKQMGGNLSSVIALLDQDNNGLVLNTVQNINGCYSYVKEVRGGRSNVDFTEEEREAMEIATGFYGKVREEERNDHLKREGEYIDGKRKDRRS